MAALLLAMLFTAPRAEANAGPPYYANGKIAAEPSGMAGITIAHETLVIDMRRLPASPPSMLGKSDPPKPSYPIDVSVAYSITNSGPAREIALIFASGAPSTAGFSATLNGRPIAAQPATDVAVPAEWQPPATTPGLNGKDLIYLDPARDTFDAQQVEPWGHYPRIAERSATSSYAFTATIPAGDSVLAVRYQAEPQQHRSGGYTDQLKSYQFAYVLAPARAWDGFGDLDVTVHLPACWAAASRPELARAGDELRGSFDAVPADALALTVAPCDVGSRQADLRRGRVHPAFGRDGSRVRAPPDERFRSAGLGDAPHCRNHSARACAGVWAGMDDGVRSRCCPSSVIRTACSA